MEDGGCWPIQWPRAPRPHPNEDISKSRRARPISAEQPSSPLYRILHVSALPNLPKTALRNLTPRQTRLTPSPALVGEAKRFFAAPRFRLLREDALAHA